MRYAAIVVALSFLILASLATIGAGAPAAGAGLPGRPAQPGAPERDTIRREREQLGKLLFFDTNLSEPRGTSCASCHDPRRAFSGNHGSTIGVPLGSRPGTYGLRNTPSLTYASFIPPFNIDAEEEVGATIANRLRPASA